MLLLSMLLLVLLTLPLLLLLLLLLLVVCWNTSCGLTTLRGNDPRGDIAIGVTTPHQLC